MTEMPEDFWPDEVLVIGKYKDHELGFAITVRSFLEGYQKDAILPSLEGLRRFLWNEVHINKKESV